ncbi:uncharacterized protein LOC128957985 [Oppia nitens]|uniref:uncharacterized protein LOC128957985 n=1 Tax=Oppia nitens TaxID=1686743 RepID=UPI0023DC55A8|nr:uncharacterized protein LOC128957985 [Oppia nitens]
MSKINVKADIRRPERRTLEMKFLLFCVFYLSTAAAALRLRRAAYDLPPNAQDITGLSTIRKTFKCEKDGYFADTDNECKLFHICATPSGQKSTPNQETMFCPKEQRFDQSKQKCVVSDDAIPCSASKEFFYLNDRIGTTNSAFLGPQERDMAAAARPDYRARAKLVKSNKSRNP